MIIFSTLRFSSFSRSHAALIGVALLVNFFATPAQAQGSDELFRGTWQIETPDQGALIMIVKSQNRASYFWGDNTDRTVYQGTWASEENAATLTWADGSRHRIERDSLGFGVTFFDANGRERYTSQAQQVPTEILGQWAKPPSQEAEALSARDQAKGFFGVWKVGRDDSSAEYVFVESDRSAASTEGGGNGLRGSWARQGSELHIAWDSGHYSILRENRREFAYKRIEPGRVIEDDESESLPAVRTIEERVPSAWMANYSAEREIFTGGIAFSSRKVARDFYRGDWIVKYDENQFERIEIGRFGGLSSTIERGLEGDWRMQGQDIFMRWDDGMRKILSPIGRGFVLYEFRPGRPLDGVPTRIRAAAPADSAKLAEHLKGREDVAEQILNMAEAAGIDPSQQSEAGWGRTFARWAWPFGEDETATTPKAMLDEAYAPPAETDPWWWPFWSEKPAAEAVSTETPENSETDLQIDASSDEEVTEMTPIEDEITTETTSLEEPAATDATTESATEDEETNPTAEKKRSSARDWVWPF
jgi:hypothetical protein